MSSGYTTSEYLILAIFCLVVLITMLVISLYLHRHKKIEIDHTPVIGAVEKSVEKSATKIISEIRAVHQRQDIHDKKQDSGHSAQARFMIRILSRFGFLVDPKIEPPNFVPPKPPHENATHQPSIEKGEPE